MVRVSLLYGLCLLCVAMFFTVLADLRHEEKFSRFFLSHLVSGSLYGLVGCIGYFFGIRHHLNKPKYWYLILSATVTFSFTDTVTRKFGLIQMSWFYPFLITAVVSMFLGVTVPKNAIEKCR